MKLFNALVILFPLLSPTTARLSKHVANADYIDAGIEAADLVDRELKGKGKSSEPATEEDFVEDPAEEETEGAEEEADEAAADDEIEGEVEEADEVPAEEEAQGASLKALGTLSLDLLPPVVFPSPQGTRVVYPFAGGRLEGPALNATVNPSPGGDWATIRQDGSITLDIRLIMKSDDGYDLFLTVIGRSARNDDGVTANITVAQQYETDTTGPYAYLNNMLTVGVGTFFFTGLTVDTYELVR